VSSDISRANFILCPHNHLKTLTVFPKNCQESGQNLVLLSIFSHLHFIGIDFYRAPWYILTKSKPPKEEGLVPVFQLNESISFPPPQMGREDGLLAIGGDLSPERLLLAYHLGIFPWYSPGEPILWWSPDPRMVLFPDAFHLSKSLAKTIRRKTFTVTFDHDFPAVIRNCATIRQTREAGTWISEEMIAAYCNLHELGYAHSVECWRGDELMGGLYGVALGSVFFGESMFSLAPNGSKVALAALVRQLVLWEFDMIDCQVDSAHLQSLGAEEISGAEFWARLALSVDKPTLLGKWSKEPRGNSPEKFSGLAHSRGTKV
jgi:leucyl/phenylalanyl-tRNA--protein transferase